MYGKLNAVALVLILVTLLNVMVGNAFTVAVPVAISCSVASVDVQVMFPLAPLLALLFNLKYIVVLLTVPAVCVKVTVEP